MQNKLFLKAADICELLEVKQTSAYEIIGNLNKELEEQGYLTLRGKVPTKYFVKRFYGVEDTCEIRQSDANAHSTSRQAPIPDIILSDDLSSKFFSTFHTFQSDTLSLLGGTGLDNTDRPLLKYN